MYGCQTAVTVANQAQEHLTSKLTQIIETTTFGRNLKTKMTKKDKNKGGRPKYKIDYETLDDLCSIMCTGEEISAILNIDYDTLNRRLEEEGHTGFTDYYKRKSANGKKSLRRVQYDQAIDGNTTMMVWLGKQWLNQADKQEVEINATMQVNFNMNFGSK